MKHIFAILVFISTFGFSQTSTIYPNFDFELGNLNNWTFFKGQRSMTQHSVASLSSCTPAVTPTNQACGLSVVDTSYNINFCGFNSVTPVPGKYFAQITSGAGLNVAIACYQFTVNAIAPIINVDYLQYLITGSGETYSVQPFNQIVIKDVSTGSVIPGSFEDFSVTTHSTIGTPVSPPYTYCLGWINYKLNLTSYVGQVLRFEFLSTGCAYSGHSQTSWFDGYFSTVTGIKESDLPRSIQIFPNPANDFITIKKPFDEELRILIYDFQGRIVKEEFSDKIDISDLQKGLYFIRAIGKQNNYSQTFIKE
ncbi:MAG: T9SS type A sorting domain-containing protein [Bacteroidia bacterium]|nr:T9SS type A sorting domain-containing protein [Bacteroidia bacterium]